MKPSAPEKLYIAINELTEDGRTFVLDHHVDYPICTEYTRTDVFIEKASKWIIDNFPTVSGISALMYADDFKKAMKL